MTKEIFIKTETVKLFGLNFLTGGYNDIKNRLFNGALMVAPSAPSLVILDEDIDYRQAMLGSDFAICDSGLMVLLLRLFKDIQIKKHSGLEFLRRFLKETVLMEHHVLFMIEPSEEDKVANQYYLYSLGIKIEKTDHYVAPMYGNNAIQDAKLLELVMIKKPRFILINLGGGVQEKLGYYLKTNLDYRPGIICTGAAIAFLTGKQVGIPEFADRFYLGWLMRCLWRPTVYIPRYLTGLKLILMIWRAEVEQGIE